MKKKLLVLLLAAVLCLGLAVPALAAEDITVTPGGSRVHTWAKDEITRAETEKLVPAPLAGKDLTGPITRAQFASVAVRLYEAMQGKEAQAGSNVPFTDIGGPEGTYYTDICKAFSLEIINGATPTTFDPDSTLTREQAATMLGRVYGKLVAPIPAGMPTFADSGEISDYARDSVAFMSGKGIVKGVDSSHFAPQDDVTAEQAVILALRMKASTGTGTDPVTPTPGEQDSIVGAWEYTRDIADTVNQPFAAQGLGDYIKLDSAVLVVRYTFNSNGTYSCTVDEASLNKIAEDMKKASKAGMIAYVKDMIAAQGLEGVMTPEDVFAAMGTDVDKMVDEIFSKADIVGTVKKNDIQGNYKTGDGKLWLSAGLNYLPDENMYHHYTIQGDTLTILDLVGGDGSDTVVYPMVFKRAG